MKKLTGLMLLFVCSSAWAIPVTWTLNGVAISWQDDGGFGSPGSGIVTGSFTYDADTNVYSNVYIRTPDANFWWGADYTDTVLIYGNPPAVFNPVLSASSGGLTINSGGFGSVGCGFNFCEGNLYLVFASPLTNAGGTVSLVPSSLGGSREVELQSGSNDGVLNSRTIESGSLVGAAAVPVPAAIWLFGSALAGLGWMGRKRVV